MSRAGRVEPRVLSSGKGHPTFVWGAPFALALREMRSGIFVMRLLAYMNDGLA